MPVDQYSPIAPARIRVLLVPVGRIKRSRFMTFAGRLEPQSTIRLGDITPDPRPDRTMFSPLSNPNGKLLYNFTTSAPPASYLALSPFELHREPLMILGIADGKEYEIPGTEGSQSPEHGGSADPEREAFRSELKPVVELLREQYPKALVHNLLIFDSSFESKQPWFPEGTIQVPPLERSKMTTLKTLVCDLSAVLLGEMATLSKSFQALPEIHLTSTPTTEGFAPRTPYDLTRQFSTGAFSPISDSRSSTPFQSENPRFSVAPQLHSSRTSTPTLQDASGTASTMGSRISSPSADGEETPADSRPQAQNRFSIQSIQGFGSGGPVERQKTKELAQQLVVNSSINLMAGKLKETIHDLEIAAGKSKDAGDNAFLAKALELMLVCFLLCAVQGVPFQIPAICFSGLRTSSLDGNLPALLELIPRLCETITSYYRRTLPTLPFAEWTLRYMRLILIVMMIGRKETSETAGEALAGYLDNIFIKLEGPVSGRGCKEIADTLLRDMQPILETSSSVEDAERLELLAETARCLSIVGFERKQAFVTKTLVDSLVPALVKARKAGAAEAGIHPAASLIGIGKQSLSKSISANDNTLFLDHLGRLYGISVRKKGQDQLYGPVKYIKNSGSFPLKCDVLRSCINVSEAMGEFKGVLSFSATLLHLGGPHMPLNPTDPRFRSLLSREEQIRLAGTIIRTVEAAHHAGFEDLEAEYWDECLLRDVSRSRVPGSRTLVSHQMSDIDESIEAEHKHGPFLHNAFASRAHDDIPETPVIVGEMAELFVTLQNPFEFEVEIEALSLVFNEEDIVDTLHPFRVVLRPRGLHRFLVEWYPEKEGSLMLTGCSIKVRGCRERLFQVFSDVHDSPEESNVKPNVTAVKITAESKPVAVAIPTPVIEKQPSVVMRTSLNQSALSLMEGETKVFTVFLEHAKGCRKTPAKFIRMSLQNTVTDALEKRMSNKKLALTDWHYLDAARRNSAWRCSSGDERFEELSARVKRDWAVALFEIQVKGTRDLTGGTVILDYASTTPPPVLKDRYITSRVSAAVDVTVERSVVMAHLKVVTGKDAPSYVKLAFPDDSPSDFFVVFCRYRNDSSKTMSVRMQPFVATGAEAPSANAIENGEVQRDVSIYPEELIIQPGQTSICRQVVRRIFLPRSQQPVPEAQGRQYIYDGSVRSALEEQQGREMFWYRVELLNRLRATWTEVTSAVPGGRTGEVTRPTVDVTPEMVAAMKHETVLLTTEVANIDGKSILQDGPASYRVARNSRVRLNIQISNPTGHEIRGTIRLKPKFDDPTVDVPDIRKQLDRRVPSFVLGPDATITKATEFWAMVVGVSMMLDVVFYEEGNVMRTYKSASCMVSFF